jgi:hypothetical protein
MSTQGQSASGLLEGPEPSAATPPPGVQLFPHFLFRTTALPLNVLEPLGSPASAELARRVLAAEARRDELAEAFLAGLRRHVSARSVTPALSRAGERVRRRRALEPDKLAAVRAAGHALEAAQLEAYDTAVRAAEAAAATGESVLAEELAQARTALRARAADPRVREAVLLSSPGALEGLDRFQSARDTRPALERRALRYVQRMCSKNDTISFFGPMTWGRFDPDAPAGLDLQWRDAGLSSRHVFFEHWAADRLARALEQDRELRGALVFRVRYPFEWGPEGLSMHHALAGRMRRASSPAQAALLRACDAGLPAAAAFVQASAEADAPLADLETVLDALLEAGTLEAFAVPVEALEPVHDLLVSLRAAAPPSAGRARWEERLEALLRLQQRFTSADVDARRTLLAEIESHFTAWTGAAPRRNAGRTYGGRNLVYEDCTRQPERFTIGGRVLADLQSDLDSLLAVHSALLEVLEPYGWQRLEEIHAGMARGGRAVPLTKFLLKVFGLVGSSYLDARLVPKQDQEPLLERARAALEIRHDGPGRLHVAARDPGAVARAGLLRRPVIPGVDLMIAARDQAALEAGDYRFVVGEVQYFPLGYPEYLFTFHPDPRAFRADYERVLAGPRAGGDLPLLRVELEDQVTRLLRMREPLADYVLVDGHGRTYDRARPQRRMSELTAHLEHGRVIAEDRAGQRFLLGNPHHDLFLDAAFKLLNELLRRAASATGAPQELIVGRRTVLLRRQWSLAAEALGASAQAEGGARDAWSRAPFAAFVAVQRARQAAGLPRHAFARLPGEVKPVLVDFDSALLVENLARMASAGQTVALSEMRPGPGELWLGSAAGQHTSELRVLLG